MGKDLSIMRLIKLSKEEFRKEEDIEHFFGPEFNKNKSILEQREPPGTFYISESRIGKNGIKEGETLLFTYDGKLRFIAKSASGRLTKPGKKRFPNYFVIDMNSLRQSKPIRVNDLEKLFDGVRGNKSFKGQPWVILPDTADSLSIISKLIVDGLEEIAEQDIKAEEIEQGKFTEGKQTTILVNKYERNSKAKAEAIRIHGLECLACGFNFENFYGKRGANYIQVHHLKPIASYEGEVDVSPANDLAVVCSNCHSMIHRYPKTPLNIKDLKKIIEAKKDQR